MIIISNFTNKYTPTSYNTQQKVDIVHLIRLKTSYAKFSFVKK